MTDIDSARPSLPTVSRLTALFQRGEVVELGTDDEGQVLVWVNALTTIEREECVLDGAVAQAAAREFNGPGSDPYEAMLIELEKADRDTIIAALCTNRATEAWTLGQNDLHADEDWRGDKLLLIERMDASVKNGMELTEDELAKFTELNEAYLAAWKAKSTARVEAMRAEYATKETRELISEHLRAWVDSRALAAQVNEYRISQLYFSVRVCHAIKRDDSYDHTGCRDHQDLVFPSRLAVRRSSDALLDRLFPVADGLDKRGGDALGKR